MPLCCVNPIIIHLCEQLDYWAHAQNVSSIKIIWTYNIYNHVITLDKFEKKDNLHSIIAYNSNS